MFIPGPNFKSLIQGQKDSASGSASKNVSGSESKFVSYPGSGFRIRVVKKAPDPGSRIRIRNTAKFTILIGCIALTWPIVSVKSIYTKYFYFSLISNFLMKYDIQTVAVLCAIFGQKMELSPPVRHGRCTFHSLTISGFFSTLHLFCLNSARSQVLGDWEVRSCLWICTIDSFVGGVFSHALLPSSPSPLYFLACSVSTRTQVPVNSWPQ